MTFKGALEPKEYMILNKVCEHITLGTINEHMLNKVIDYVLEKLLSIKGFIDSKTFAMCYDVGDVEDNFSQLQRLVTRLEIHMEFLRRLEREITKEKIVSITPPYRDFLFSKKGKGFLTQKEYL